jgi:hypothetical protein
MVQTAILFPYTNDDAYISLRYARNWAQGSGPVYNPGERVEGYSNFLWVLLEYTIFLVDANAEVWIKIIGIFLAIVTILYTWFVPRIESSARYLAGGLLVAQTSFWLWAWAGLETPLYALLLLVAVDRFRTELANENMFPVSAVFFFLLSMTRPEGFLFGFISGIYLAAHYGVRKMVVLKQLTWLAVAWGGYFAYWCGRYVYYGYPFPNSYYVKTGGGYSQYMQGVSYLNQFFWSEGYYPFLLASVFLFLLRSRNRSLLSWYLPTVIAAQIMFIIYAGGDQFPMFRFMVPVAPLLYLFYMETFFPGKKLPHEMEDRPSEKSSHVRELGLAIIILLVAALWWVNGTVYRKNYWMKRGFHLARYQENQRRESLIPIAEWLKNHGGKDTSIAVGWAGAIPYVSGLNTIDMLGINDIHIAHRDMPWDQRFFGHVKHDAEYVLDKAPDYIILSVPRSALLNNEPIPFPPDHALLASPRFQNMYRLVIPSITRKEETEFAVFQRAVK